MIMTNKVKAKPTCSDFLIDVVANRLSWISKSNLIELAAKAGHIESNTNAQIRRCHTNGGVEPTNWRKMGRQHFLSGLAAIAVVSTSNSTSKKLVAAPTAMSSVKLNRFIDQLNSMQVQYELW